MSNLNNKPWHAAGYLHLGEGEFVENRLPYWVQFFKAIERVAPKILETLQIDVLPIFSAQMKLEPTPGEVESWIADINSEIEDIDPRMLRELLSNRKRGQEYGRLVTAVQPKIEDLFWKSNIFGHQVSEGSNKKDASKIKTPISTEKILLISPQDKEYLVECAFNTLKSWYAYLPSSSASLRWDMVDKIGFFQEPPFVSFSIREWDVRSERKTEARNRMLEDLKSQVQSYLDMKEAEAVRDGLVSYPDTDKPVWFEWLVLYQVCECSTTDIAKRYREQDPKHDGLSRVSVDDARDRVAERMVGEKWKKWLRSAPRGRPAKKPLT